MIAQSNKAGSALVVAKDSPVKGMGDLKGRVVAIPGHATIQDVLLRMALKQSAIKPTELTIMVLKPPEMISALRSGDIDAFIAWEPYPAKAFTMGVGRTLAASRDIWKDHPCCVLAADTKFMEMHLEKAKGVVRGHIKAIDYIRQHREEAIKIGIKYTGWMKLLFGWRWKMSIILLSSVWKVKKNMSIF